LSESVGISSQGKSAEDLFIKLTGAQKAAKAALGDAILENRFVEVKRASGSTLNQVRALKYIPLVVYEDTSDSWYVVPAHVVVLEVSRKSRGQHTENPFESATMSLRRLGAYRLEDESQLRHRTLAAIEQSDAYPELQQLMRDILSESEELAVSSLTRVRQALADLGISAS
jgi:hypothetical protein